MVPKTGTIFLGRDRASRVTSAPRGLGLYRRAGREGFFYVKNLAAQAKRYPGRLETTYVDEQIRSATGELVTTQKEAEAYCHRRNAEIAEMLLSLKGEFISYSGSDLEAIAQTLADKWIRGHQRGLNLQDLNLERMAALAKYASATAWHGTSNWAEMGAWLGMHQVDEEGELGPARYSHISGNELENEANKLLKLCWSEGFRPSPKALPQIMVRFTTYIREHASTASQLKEAGTLAPPAPHAEERGLSWERLVNAKESEGIADGTLQEIKRALERLKKWLRNQHQINLPTGLDTELALSYRSWIYGKEIGLKHSTASKEIRYLSATWSAAKQQQFIPSNPWSNLPKNRRTAMRTRIEARKTHDINKVLGPELVKEIYERMESNKRGIRDPGFEIFYLQAVTGTRIQEVAGLRCCDFTMKIYKGKSYYCIEIRPWSGRGFSAMGDRGGIKTTQSERTIPLPKAALPIWNKYQDNDNKEPAFPEEAPKKETQNWGDNLARRMRDKIPDFPGTHSWRETMINNLLNTATPIRVVEMLTGKTGNTPLRQYTSDGLDVMQKAIEKHYKLLNIPKI